MSDIGDRANDRAEELLHDALAARQRQRERLASTNPGSSPDCADCGATIPAVRRQALPDCTRCIACQTTFEKGPRPS